MIKTKTLGLLYAFSTTGLLFDKADAAVVLYLYQDGPNLAIASNGGTVNTNGLTSAGNTGSTLAPVLFYGIDGTLAAVRAAQNALVTFDSGLSEVSRVSSPDWTDPAGISAFKSGTFLSGNATLGVRTGFNDDHQIYVGFNELAAAGSNNAIITIDPFVASTANINVATQGYTDGSSVTYSWNTGSGTDQIQLVIGAPVPEPSSLFLLGFGAMSILRRRR